MEPTSNSEMTEAATELQSEPTKETTWQLLSPPTIDDLYSLASTWKNALKYNKIGQCSSRLRSLADNYCCLGVLLHVIDDKRWVKDFDEDRYYYVWERTEEYEVRMTGTLEAEVFSKSGLKLQGDDDRVMRALNMTREMQRTFYKMNDGMGGHATYTFEQIAPLVETLYQDGITNPRWRQQD